MHKVFNMPTPAERAAARKPKKHPPRRPVVWVCRVREFREKHGLSLRDVERETGITNATVYNIEIGNETTLGHARALAVFFGTTVDVLWPRRAK